MNENHPVTNDELSASSIDTTNKQTAIDNPRRDVIVPTALVATMVGLAYAVAFAHRSDYMGHYLAGFGATLVLLSALSLRTLDNRLVAGVVVFSVLCGVVAERTVFRSSIADPVDVGNQTVGAAFAGIAMLNRAPSRQLGVGTAALGLLMLAWGFLVAHH